MSLNNKKIIITDRNQLLQLSVNGGSGIIVSDSIIRNNSEQSPQYGNNSNRNRSQINKSSLSNNSNLISNFSQAYSAIAVNNGISSEPFSNNETILKI